MDAHACAVLDFERVRQALRRHAATDLSRRIIEALAPSAQPDRLALSLQQVDEARLLLAQGEPIPVRGLSDVVRTIERARSRNVVLEPSELLAIATFVEAAEGLRRFFADKAAAPALKALAAKILDHRPFHAQLVKAIRAPGVVADEASPKLKEIREECARIETKIRGVLDELLDSPRLRSILQERSYSVRNGRFVVPVKLEMKGHLSGILHDKSASGSTAFIEPREVASLANELADLRLDESREVARILFELTKSAFAEEPRLQHTQNVAAWLDFTRARAAFSHEIGGIAPRVAADGAIRLRGARHPLLVLQAQEGGLPHAVVPLSLELGRAFRMLIVTGPNTGGKTVVLKTIGLLQIMFQCGLHVPALEGSELPVLDDVLADIGDEQSLQQNLSTFSGHVRQVARVIANAGPKTLVLLDELGAGTDPVEGAALSRAILEDLLAKRALCVVTTHLGTLKGFAYSRPGAENAAMSFDGESLQPTFELLIGLPGSSHALLVARRHGIASGVVDEADRILSGERDVSHELIEGLATSRQAVEAARKSSEDLLAEARARLEGAREELAKAEREKTRLEAEANAELGRSFRELEESARPHLNALKNVPKALIENVEALEQIIARKRELKTVGDRRREFLAGVRKDDQVWVPRFQQMCRVRKINRGEERLSVQLGALTVEISFDDVSFVGPQGSAP
jgi:DNA mismatch repair protein MutS2